MQTNLGKTKLTIGILGGMGPMATADLFQKIILLVKANKDQDHLHVIIDSDPIIPDRTAFLLDRGDDPTPFLIKVAKNLQKAGADLIAIPCNTAHFFYEKIQDAVKIEVLHMVKETVNYIENAKLSSALLLATNGTIKTQIYNKFFKDRNLRLLFPPEDLQHKVMESIYLIKAGNLDSARNSLLKVISRMSQYGGECIIAACTEIPLVVKQDNCAVKLIDPTAVLASVAVGRAFV